VSRSFLALLALSVPGIAMAAESGQIRGRVLDQSGQPVAGVEVTLSGASIAGELTTTTDTDGTFRFTAVPIGTHSVLFISETLAPVRAEVTVRQDESAFVPVSMKPMAADVSEEIVVEEALPVVDTTRSAFAAEMSSELLANLPVGRSYQDAVNMLPGVYGRVDTDEGGASDGNPSVRGEGQYGNNYLVDGISTRDPATKTFGTDVMFDAIEDIQVYTDGAPAEFGNFAGMVVDVAIKDGGDENHGTVSYYLSTDASSGTYEIYGEDASKRDFLTHEVALTAGGPIVKEKLWYFGAVSIGSASQIFEGMNPDTPYGSRSFTGLGKITWFATPDLTARLMLNGSWLNLENEQLTGTYLPESQSQRLQYDVTPLATVEFRPDALTQIELKVGLTDSHLDVIPMSEDENAPAIVDVQTSQTRNNYTSFDYNKRQRVGGVLSVTRALENVAGDHRFKAGAEYWMLEDARRVRFTGPEGGRKYQADEGFPCVEADFSDCASYFQYRDNGFLGHSANLLAAYLQDDWTLFDTLTMNLGVRVDNERVFQNSGVQLKVGDLPGLHVDPFLYDETTGEVIGDNPDYIEPYSDKDTRDSYNPIMPAPRLGLSWDATGDNKTLVSANYGRYYDVSGADFIQWGDTKSDAYFELWENDGTGNFVQTFVQDPVGNPLIYDAELEPPHMDKLAIAVEREIFPLFAVSVRGILSKTANLPEDVDYDLNNWFVTNPDILCADDAPSSCGKHRDYRALEITANKRFDERWQLLASYTLSEAKGHAPGQFERATGGDFGSNGNNVGVYLDDVNYYYPEDVPEELGGYSRKDLFDIGYGFFVDGLNGLGTTTDDGGWYGYLPYHSFHQVKINGSYTLPTNTTFAAVYEFDSGHAWQKRTWVELYGDYSGLGEGRGSRFMPAVHYIDVRVAQKWDLQNERSLELMLDFFNLPDFEQAVAYHENDDENFGLTRARQAPRAVRAGMRFTY
jgi:hypothetical protein